MADCRDCDGEGKEEDICPTQRDVEELKKKIKAPDRAKFERELEKINTAIREQEAKYRSFQSLRTQGMASSHVSKDRETLMTELRSFKAEREREIDTRKKIDQELKGLNSLVQRKNDACGKLQAGLKFKTEARADEAIRRLEHQLRVQQLKLREETRLVTEIDSLKRSKKLIHEFDALKQEIAQLRERQNALRKQRDNCMRTISRLKSNEEEIKSSLDEQRSKDLEAKQQQRGYNTEKNVLKKEIDDLYSRKRALVNVFNKEKEEHSALLKDIREQERHIKKEVEAMKRIEKRHLHRQRHGSESAEDTAHQTMINICDSLIIYFKGLNINTKPQDSQSHSEHPPDIIGNEASFSGGSFLKKKMDDDLEEMYAGTAKRSSRRMSRKGRKSAQKENIPKKLVLHPAVLDQFLSLTITPPSTAAEIPKVLELLIEKKENLNSVIDLPVPMPRSPSPSSSSESSLENFPSLPSLQESEASVHSATVKDEFASTVVKEKLTNEKCAPDGIKNDENVNIQTEMKENTQDIEEYHNDNTEESATSDGNIEENVNHNHKEVEIENVDEELNSGLPRETYTREEQISNESKKAKQNGPLRKEYNNSQMPCDRIEGVDLLDERSNDESQSLDVEENILGESTENHVNDMKDEIDCGGEEKPSAGLKEDQLIVMTTDRNSSIKCPS